MYKSILILAGIAAVAAFAISRQCDDGHGLSEAEMRGIACADLAGEWEKFLVADDSMPTGRLNMATGGTARFSLDDKGRVFTKDLDINARGRAGDPNNPVINVGRAYCRESGSTFEFVRGGQVQTRYELTAAGELRRPDNDGMAIVYRRPRPFCPF